MKKFFTFRIYNNPNMKTPSNYSDTIDLDVNFDTFEAAKADVTKELTDIALGLDEHHTADDLPFIKMHILGLASSISSSISVNAIEENFFDINDPILPELIIKKEEEPSPLASAASADVTKSAETANTTIAAVIAQEPKVSQDKPSPLDPTTSVPVAAATSTETSSGPEPKKEKWDDWSPLVLSEEEQIKFRAYYPSKIGFKNVFIKNPNPDLGPGIYNLSNGLKTKHGTYCTEVNIPGHSYVFVFQKEDEKKELPLDVSIQGVATAQTPAEIAITPTNQSIGSGSQHSGNEMVAAAESKSFLGGWI